MTEDEQWIARYHTKINFQRDEIRALRELVAKLQQLKREEQRSIDQPMQERGETLEMER